LKAADRILKRKSDRDNLKIKVTKRDVSPEGFKTAQRQNGFYRQS